MSLVGIIPAAGKSTRMGQPKHMMIHRGKPIICHVLDQMIRTRVDKIIIVYNDEGLPKMIGNDYFGVHIDYVKQEEQLGIGHAIMQCREHVPEYSRMLIILGDVYFDGDLNPMRQKFYLSDKVVMFGVQRVKNKNLISESYGISGKSIIEKPGNTFKFQPLLGLGIYFAREPFFEVLENSEMYNGEIGITEGIDFVAPAYREWFELDGKYENINYRKQIK